MLDDMIDLDKPRTRAHLLPCKLRNLMPPKSISQRSWPHVTRDYRTWRDRDVFENLALVKALQKLICAGIQTTTKTTRACMTRLTRPPLELSGTASDAVNSLKDRWVASRSLYVDQVE